MVLWFNHGRTIRSHPPEPTRARTPAATVALLAAISPSPLKTSLSRTRYPFAVACVKAGQITHTMAYSATLAECYAQVQGWNGSRLPSADYHFVMAEQREIGEAVPNVCVNTYWAAV